MHREVVIDVSRQHLHVRFDERILFGVNGQLDNGRASGIVVDQTFRTKVNARTDNVAIVVTSPSRYCGSEHNATSEQITSQTRNGNVVSDDRMRCYIWAVDLDHLPNTLRTRWCRAVNVFGYKPEVIVGVILEWDVQPSVRVNARQRAHSDRIGRHLSVESVTGWYKPIIG